MTVDNSDDLNKLMIQRRKKMEEIEGKGIKPYGEKYKTTHHAKDIENNFADLEEKTGLQLHEVFV